MSPCSLHSNRVNNSSVNAKGSNDILFSHSIVHSNLDLTSDISVYDKILITSTSRSSMSNIFFLGNIFQIFWDIIQMVAVFMINHQPRWAWTYKALSNKAMDVLKLSNFINGDFNLPVAIGTIAIRESPICSSPWSVLNSFYESIIANDVIAFKTWGRFPYLVHKKNLSRLWV